MQNTNTSHPLSASELHHRRHKSQKSPTQAIPTHPPTLLQNRAQQTPKFHQKRDSRISTWLKKISILHQNRWTYPNNLDKIDTLISKSITSNLSLQTELLVNTFEANFTSDSITHPKMQRLSALKEQHLPNLYTSEKEPILISLSIIKNKIQSLKNQKALDTDEIPNFSLKHLPKDILTLLLKIFNTSLRHSHFATPWKRSINRLRFIHEDKLAEIVSDVNLSKACMKAHMISIN